MLQLNLSKAEIETLNYERYYYPCPKIRKRISAVYFKATRMMSNEEIGKIADLNRDSVSDWVNAYLKDGFDSLCCFKYGTNKSLLENHSDKILKSLTERPPKSVNEAKFRIKKIT